MPFALDCVNGVGLHACRRYCAQPSARNDDLSPRWERMDGLRLTDTGMRRSGRATWTCVVRWWPRAARRWLVALRTGGQVLAAWRSTMIEVGHTGMTPRSTQPISPALDLRRDQLSDGAASAGLSSALSSPLSSNSPPGWARSAPRYPLRADQTPRLGPRSGRCRCRRQTPQRSGTRVNRPPPRRSRLQTTISRESKKLARTRISRTFPCLGVLLRVPDLRLRADEVDQCGLVALVSLTAR
jgi:hypothetical protein